MKQFVLSASEFESKSEAEKKVNEWWKQGKLEKKDIKLYEVKEIYELKMKFEKVK